LLGRVELLGFFSPSWISNFISVIDLQM